MKNEIKMSCLPVSLFPMLADGSLTLKEMAIKMKALGFDAMDVSFFHLKEHLPNNIKKINQLINNINIIHLKEYITKKHYFFHIHHLSILYKYFKYRI